MKMTGQFIAATPGTAFAACSLLFASTVFAQPVSDSLGDLLVGNAAFGDWRTDAPLVRRKITDLLPPYATRSASNPPPKPFLSTSVSICRWLCCTWLKTLQSGSKSVSAVFCMHKLDRTLIALAPSRGPMMH